MVVNLKIYSKIFTDYVQFDKHIPKIYIITTNEEINDQ